MVSIPSDRSVSRQDCGTPPFCELSGTVNSEAELDIGRCQPSVEGRGSVGRVRGANHFVVWVIDDVSNRFPYPRHRDIVDNDNAALFKHPVYVKEVEERVIERMPTIDERELKLATCFEEGG